MNCDPNALAAAAKAFAGASDRELRIIQTYLLCQIANTGTGGGSCLLCGTVAPAAPPSCDCAIYYDRAKDNFYIWNKDTSNWDPLVILS